MQQILKHGVLGEEGFTYIDITGKRWCHTGDSIHTMHTIGDIYNLALSCGLQRVWVHTTVETLDNLSEGFISEAKKMYVTGEGTLENYAYFDVYRRQEAYSYEVGIHFTAHPYSKWKVIHASDSEDRGRGVRVNDKELYIAVAYLERLLHIPLRYSAGKIGQDLIRETNKGKKEKNLQPCTSDLSLFIKSTGASRPFHRALTKEECNKKWLHSLDKNANFLGSSNIQLGIGDYDVVQHPTFSKHDVGLWNVTIEGSSLYEGVSMPSACTLLLEGKRTGWIYTATAQLLLDLGYSLTFHEVKIWPKEKRTTILDDWCKLFSYAYTELRVNVNTYKDVQARELAKEMMKGMYVKGLSWLTMDIEESRGNYIDRPDWYHLVIAEAYQKMIRNIMAYEKLGLKPLLMNNDELMYASDEEDIQLAFPTLRTEKKPSHYKKVFTLPLAECKHLFTLENTTANIKRELKRIAEEHGYSL